MEKDRGIIGGVRTSSPFEFNQNPDWRLSQGRVRVVAFDDLFDRSFHALSLFNWISKSFSKITPVPEPQVLLSAILY
jgi:hypothetical protein